MNTLSNKSSFPDLRGTRIYRDIMFRWCIGMSTLLTPIKAVPLYRLNAICSLVRNTATISSNSLISQLIVISKTSWWAFKNHNIVIMLFSAGVWMDKYSIFVPIIRMQPIFWKFWNAQSPGNLQRISFTPYFWEVASLVRNFGCRQVVTVNTQPPPRGVCVI